MKTNSYKFILIIIITTIISYSCNKPDDSKVGPTLEFVEDQGYISTDTLWASGDTAVIGLRCISDGVDAVRSIFISYNNKEYGNPVEINPAMGMDFTFKLKITKSQLFVETYSFEVVDSRGHLSKTDLTIRLDDTGGDITTVSAILGAQSNPSMGSYFGFIDGKNYTKAFALANQNQVDMVSGYDFFAKSFLSSPGTDNTYGIYDFSAWPMPNLTQFCATSISVAQFDLINKDNLLISSFHEDKAIKIIENLKQNNIYSFKSQNGRYGLLKVIAGATNENGFISFDYKIQKIPAPKK